MDLEDGQSVQVKGSAADPYVLRNDGGIYSCTCPAWRHQSAPIDQRTCKHLKTLRGAAEELARVGVGAPASLAREPAAPSTSEGAPVLLAQAWRPDQDPTGWWMSEKLDGLRAYWDGRQFLSRLGNRFFAPPWFVEGLPEHPLDGELWGGRKRFQETSGIVRSGPGAAERWRGLAFVVFDAPAWDAPFEERVARVRETLGEGSGHVRALDHARCEGVDHLRQELLRVEGLGGEGLMLRQPGSRYQVGRSWTLLKVKSFFDDEAVVVGYEPGAGKHAGKVGSLLAQKADGVRFSVGTGLSDRDRVEPPPIGATITFRYQELTNKGVPRFPSYVGERVDKVVRLAPAPPPKTPGESMARRFEFEEGTSSKFWEVEVDGAEFTTRWGKLGTAGQSKTKAAASPAAAAAEVAKLVAEKTGKGYVEVGAVDDDEDDDDLDEDDLDDEDDDEPLVPAPKRPATDKGASVRAVAKELRPLLTDAKAKLRATFPGALPASALLAAGLDDDEVEALNHFVTTLGAVEQLVARLARP